MNSIQCVSLNMGTEVKFCSVVVLFQILSYSSRGKKNSSSPLNHGDESTSYGQKEEQQKATRTEAQQGSDVLAKSKHYCGFLATAHMEVKDLSQA